MNVHSLVTKVTFIFLFALMGWGLFLLFYLDNFKKGLDNQVASHHEQLSTYFRQEMIHHEAIEPYLQKQNFRIVKKIREISNKGRIVADGRGFQTIIYQNQYYYKVQRYAYHRLFKDLNIYTMSQKEYFAFGFVLILLIIIYLWLLKSLQPLHELKMNITRLANGDLSIDCKSDKKDEIGIVSNEFDNAVKKINLLLNSRQLFLRAVMHELKTPIAKGRIVSSLVEDSIQEDRLIHIFEKLEYLINDFAKVEEIVSNNYQLNTQNYHISSVIDRSLDMLMLETIDEKLDIELQSDFKVKVDLDLMAMVIKNLIDNGLKYSSNHRVKLLIANNSVEVHSLGSPLSRPLQEYFKPFHNELNQSNQGMGLGLYIVKSIMDMHNMDFDYHYAKESNIFIVSF